MKGVGALPTAIPRHTFGRYLQVVVVLSGSMEPGFYRGDILFLNMGSAPVRTGEIVVFNLDGREIPIVHRIIKVHERREEDHIDVLTKVRRRRLGPSPRSPQITAPAPACLPGAPWLGVCHACMHALSRTVTPCARARPRMHGGHAAGGRGATTTRPPGKGAPPPCCEHDGDSACIHPSAAPAWRCSRAAPLPACAHLTVDGAPHLQPATCRGTTITGMTAHCTTGGRTGPTATTSWGEP